MRYMKKIYIISTIVLGSIFSSCDGFLTELPKHQLTIENVVTDYSAAKNLVNGMYSTYGNDSYLGGYLYSYLASQASLWDEHTKLINMSYHQGDEAYISSIWQSLYRCIDAANASIKAISEANIGLFPSEKAKNALIAEARCFRGFFNLQLLWCFGHWFEKADSPYGIIYRDELSILTNLMLDRSTVGESYQYIIDDLKYAEQELGDYTSPRYMSKQFAQVMLAKLYLVRGWDGDYTNALTLVNTVMTTAPAKFKMESSIVDLYENAWDSEELLFGRYLGDNSKATDIEFVYSYALGYNSKFEDIPMAWLKNDPRYEYTFGSARAPETWDKSIKQNILTKLYHRGRYDGPSDKYCAYVFRYAELYLMKAELLARTNPTDIAGALKPVNDMLANYTTPVFTPISTPASYQDLMDIIFKQYVVTLFLENETAWFASIRFKTEGDTWLKKLKGNVSYSTNQYCWPIPDVEITAHINKIEQNPGLD